MWPVGGSTAMPTNCTVSAEVPPDGAVIYYVCVRVAIPLQGYRKITYKVRF